jgi:hypothetical protein
VHLVGFIIRKFKNLVCLHHQHQLILKLEMEQLSKTLIFSTQLWCNRLTKRIVVHCESFNIDIILKFPTDCQVLCVYLRFTLCTIFNTCQMKDTVHLCLSKCYIMRAEYSRVATAVMLAPWPFSDLQCSPLFKHSAASNKVQYLSDRDVNKVTPLQEIMA